MISFRSTPKKFEKGVFTLKTNQMISFRSTLKKFENATIAGHYGFCLRKTRLGNLKIKKPRFQIVLRVH